MPSGRAARGHTAVEFLDESFPYSLADESSQPHMLVFAIFRMTCGVLPCWKSSSPFIHWGSKFLIDGREILRDAVPFERTHTHITHSSV